MIRSLKEFLSKEETQTSRQYNLDLLKALAVICMIICHCVMRFGTHIQGYEDDFLFILGDNILGDYIAVAHAFMFAMGVGIVYSKQNTPSQLIRRGICIYILGYVLNFFRYGIYSIIYRIVEGEIMEDTLLTFLCLDILQFAGLALIATGIFKALKLKEIHMFMIGVALSVIGAPLAFVFRGNFFIEFILGHFVTTSEYWSCFVFFNWYFFVGTGILFGAILRRIDDQDRFYMWLIRLSIPVCIVYITLTAVFGPYFGSKNHWYYALSLIDAIGLLSIDMILLGAFHFMLKKVNVSRLAPFISMSKNVTAMYFISWCILGLVESVCCNMLDIVFPYAVQYAFGIILIFITYLLANLWDRMKHKQSS